MMGIITEGFERGGDGGAPKQLGTDTSRRIDVLESSPKSVWVEPLLTEEASDPRLTKEAIPFTRFTIHDN